MIAQVLWEGLYMRWSIPQVLKAATYSTIVELKTYEKELKNKASKLRRYGPLIIPFITFFSISLHLSLSRHLLQLAIKNKQS